MPGMPVTLTGVIADLTGKTITGPVKFLGEMVRTDLSVGGGPILPPEGGGGDKPPDPPDLGIWPGPGDPDFPGGGLPDPPTKPPSPQFVWGYSPQKKMWLQVFVPKQGVEPSPKRS